MQKRLTLQQLVHVIGEGFRQLFEEFDFRVEAEVADIKPYKSRLYCELIQADTQGAIIAKAKGIIWEPAIIQKFLKQSGMSRNAIIGSTLLMRGMCSFHEKYGRSISIKEISAEHTIGKQVTHREQTIQRLKNEHLRQVNHTTSLPRKPLSCAVISGQGSAGFEDFKAILDHSGHVVNIVPYYCAVHGNQASSEVGETLQKILHQLENDTQYDCICIVRGGGGKDGFLWQDDYTIGKLVAQSPVPVLIAVGHTRDTTLLDLTCYYSAKTPSDAAWYLIEHYKEIEKGLTELFVSVQHYITEKLLHKEALNTRLFETCMQSIHHRYEHAYAMIETLYATILGYNPLLQLKNGAAIVTDRQGVTQKGTLAVGNTYLLYHGDHSYEILIQSKT